MCHVSSQQKKVCVVLAFFFLTSTSAFVCVVFFDEICKLLHVKNAEHANFPMSLTNK